MGVVEAVPGRAYHVHDVCMDDCEIGKAPRSDAKHAQVVVQRRCAVFKLDALFLVKHGAVTVTRLN